MTLTEHHLNASRAAVPEGQREVILVDDDDRPIGSMSKLGAHQSPGFLHRAFSVFVFDTAGRVLLQRRAHAKYHFAGRWTNTCCSHPEPGEAVVAAAGRRLEFEMGLINVDLIDVGTFRYSAVDPDTGLVERELDHVLAGTTSCQPHLNPDECSDFRWMSPSSLQQLIVDHPRYVTPWLSAALDVALSGRDGAAR